MARLADVPRVPPTTSRTREDRVAILFVWGRGREGRGATNSVEIQGPVRIRQDKIIAYREEEQGRRQKEMESGQCLAEQCRTTRIAGRWPSGLKKGAARSGPYLDRCHGSFSSLLYDLPARTPRSCANRMLHADRVAGGPGSDASASSADHRRSLMSKQK